MIRQFIGTIAAVGLTISAGAAQAVQLAVNGDFETGQFCAEALTTGCTPTAANDPITGWQQFPGLGTQTITADSNSGSWAGRITVNTGGTPGNTVIKQANRAAGLLTPGQSVDVSFAAKGEYPDGGVLFVENFSEIAGGGVSFNDLKTFNITSDWQTFSYTTILGSDVSGGFTLQFAGVCGGAMTCLSDSFIDDVSIEASVIPVPAAVWLFGSGLLGLIGIARKKKAA